jgi:hypothetical protein
MPTLNAKCVDVAVTIMTRLLPVKVALTKDPPESTKTAGGERNVAPATVGASSVIVSFESLCVALGRMLPAIPGQRGGGGAGSTTS